MEEKGNARSHVGILGLERLELLGGEVVDMVAQPKGETVESADLGTGLICWGGFRAVFVDGAFDAVDYGGQALWRHRHR